MSIQRRRVITAQEVEAAAYSGAADFTYDSQSSIVTPLARARANDLGLALRPSGASRSQRPPLRGSEAKPTTGAKPLDDLRPELASEVLRRVQYRLDQQ